MALVDNIIGVWCEASNPETDESTNAEHLTPTAVSTVSGKVGTALSIVGNGGNAKLYHADDATLSTGDIDFTLAGWIKPTATCLGKGYTAVAGKVHSDGGAKEYLLWFQSGTGLLRFTFNDTNIDASTFGTPTADVWIYVVCRHNAAANTISIRVNDANENSTADAGGTDSGDGFAIGNFGDYGNDIQAVWDGAINQLAMWKRCITSGEETQLYNSGAGLPFASWAGGSAVAAPISLFHSSARTRASNY